MPVKEPITPEWPLPGLFTVTMLIILPVPVAFNTSSESSYPQNGAVGIVIA